MWLHSVVTQNKMKYLAFFFDFVGPLLETWNSKKLKSVQANWNKKKKINVQLKPHQTDNKILQSYAYKSPEFCNPVLFKQPIIGMEFTLPKIVLASPQHKHSGFWSLLGVITYISLLICLLPFCPNTVRVLWSRDWVCLITVVFSAGKRVSNTVDFPFIFVEYIFHLKYIPKLW